MYHFIVNPNTGRKVSIHNKLGKKILENYVNYMTGGSGCIGTEKISWIHRYTVEEYCTFLYKKYGKCTDKDIGWSSSNWLIEMKEMISKYNKKNISQITVSTLLSAKFTIQQLRSLGFKISELKQANVSDTSLKNSGYNIKEFKEAGYKNKDLKKLIFSLTEFKELDISDRDLKKLGFTITEFKKIGLEDDKLKNELKFSIVDFKNAGYKDEEIKNIGFEPNEFLNINMELKKIKKLGFTFKEFIDSINDFKKAKMAGYPIEDFKSETLNTHQNIDRLKKAGFNLIEVKKLGYNGKDLREKGFTFKDFVIAEYDPQEIKDIGFSLDDFISFNYRDELSSDSRRYYYWTHLDVYDLNSLGFSLKDFLENKHYYNDTEKLVNSRKKGTAYSEAREKGLSMYTFSIRDLEIDGPPGQPDSKDLKLRVKYDIYQNVILNSRSPEDFKADNYKLNDLFNGEKWSLRYSKNSLFEGGYTISEIIKFIIETDKAEFEKTKKIKQLTEEQNMLRSFASDFKPRVTIEQLIDNGYTMEELVKKKYGFDWGVKYSWWTKEEGLTEKVKELIKKISKENPETYKAAELTKVGFTDSEITDMGIKLETSKKYY